MGATYFLFDPHFQHRNIITFKDNDGNLMRPFASIEEHDETIIANVNALVKPADRLYIGGDVAMKRAGIALVGRLNGRKKLLYGNHDILKIKDYIKYFSDVAAYRVYPAQGIIVSHIPVHPSQLERRFKWNVHGHLHSNIVTKDVPKVVEIDCRGGPFYDIAHEVVPDERYINLCLEHTNFKPVSFDEICEKIGWEKNK